jgi:hypothetical protein
MCASAGNTSLLWFRSSDPDAPLAGKAGQRSSAPKFTGAGQSPQAG